MCDGGLSAGAIASLVGAGATAASAYSSARANRRAGNQANARQFRQIQQTGIENENQFQSDQQRSNLEFQNIQESANRANQIEAQQQQGEAQALQPLQDLQNFQSRLDDRTEQQREVFANDLNASVEAGNQNIGSGLEGNVSEAFTAASSDSQENSLSKAARLGDQRAKIGGVSALLQDDTRAVTDAGQSSQATNFAIQRQREIDQFLRGLGQNRADLLSRRAPAPVQVI